MPVPWQARPSLARVVLIMCAALQNADTLLRCTRLVIGHQGSPLLPPMDLSIRRGSLLLVVGRNGAGKSTWLETLLGLLPPVAGRVERATPPPRMAYVPQTAGLDRILPVRTSTVISWGRLRGWSFLRPFASRADRATRHRAIEQADAASLLGHGFRDLSGGQRQRVLLARVLASEADVVVLDEPTASMDVAAQTRTYARLAELAHERDMAVVVVTHMLGEAASRADEMLFLDRAATPDSGVVVSGSPRAVSAHPRFIQLFGRLFDHPEPAGETTPASTPTPMPIHTPIHTKDQDHAR